nr:MAG TPA: hypothetical protein [Caudoviricetes sp.]
MNSFLLVLFFRVRAPVFHIPLCFSSLCLILTIIFQYLYLSIVFCQILTICFFLL